MMSSRNAAIILSGGRGTRLSGIAAPFEKTLLPVNDLPVIAYASMAVVPYVEKIVLVAHPLNATAVYEAAMHGMDNVDKSITIALQPEPLGMADAIRIGLEALNEDMPVVVMCGDNIVLDDLNVKNVFNRVNGCMENSVGSKLAWTYRELDPEDAQRFSVYHPLGGERGMLVEKPSEPPSNICWCGPVAFSSTEEALRRIKELRPSARGEYEATDLMNSYLLNGEASRFRLFGAWFDIGTPESLRDARRLIQG